MKVGDRIVFVAFGAGFTSGASVVEWTADPALGRRADSVVPAASVRAPVDWDSVDPMPARLAAVLNSRNGPAVPLDDVVPGEPEHAHREVPA